MHSCMFFTDDRTLHCLTRKLTGTTSLIVAGSETSATFLSGCIFYLCTNPRVMSQLVGEIRSAFRAAKEITSRSSATLPYLAAVIEESLRMYPPFVTSLARVVQTNRAAVDGQFLPEAVRCTHCAQSACL